MASPLRRSAYLDTEEGKNIKRQLQIIAASSSYNTTSSYSTNDSLYPDNLIPFVDKHLNYLINHPKLEANKYLANIKLMTRIRQ